MKDKYIINELYWILERFYNTDYPEEILEEKLMDLANAVLIMSRKGYGDLYFIEDFIEEVAIGGFIDYDGRGEWVDAEGNAIDYIRCDVDWLLNNKPENAKFIAWYNK